MDECGETFYRRHTAQHPAAVIINNIKKPCKEYGHKSKRKAMNRNWYDQKANPALNTTCTALLLKPAFIGTLVGWLALSQN